MSTSFISQNIWSQLTKAARDSRQRCAVAVAYFGAGASRRLPLPKGSCLVVDASEHAVGSGQTCPDDLVKLQKRGIKVYSVPNLHAKVFVVGRTAYVGSANVSNNSASRLVEAVVRTTDPDAVHAAQQFVRNLCLHELTPTVLERLSKLYRPPHVPGRKKGPKPPDILPNRPALPRLLLAQLHLKEWSDRDQAAHDKGLIIAKTRQEHPRSFELESFRNTGRCPYQKGDVVIQVTDEGKSRILVTPPANVRYIRTLRNGSRRVSFVYLERPARPRRRKKTLAKKLGRGWLKRLGRNGLVRNAAIAQALLNSWAGK